MVLRWPYARLVRRCKLPKLKVASFIGGACYGCLLVMAASFFMWGFFWGIPFGGSDVLSVLFGGTDARVDARAVATRGLLLLIAAKVTCLFLLTPALCRSCRSRSRHANATSTPLATALAGHASTEIDSRLLLPR